MRLISTVLTLLLMLSTLGSLQAQTTFTITIPQDVATKEWVQDYVKKKIDSLKAATPQPPVLLPCKLGPNITDIITASKDYLTVRFDGIEVFGIDWAIHVSYLQTPIRSGKIKPTTNTIKFSYPELAKGKYILYLGGNTCTGGDTKEFTIK